MRLVVVLTLIAAACDDGALVPTLDATSPDAAPPPRADAGPELQSSTDRADDVEPDGGPPATFDARPAPDARGALPAASFTLGAHTVVVTGPPRTFRESGHGVTNTVVTDAYVYLLPHPYDGTFDPAWLTGPDLLEIAAQYLDGAPRLVDDAGRTIAGDAGYGTTVGADFNDFAGIPWTYPGGRTDPPDAVDAGNLDCSGYVRMVFGFRGGLPLGIGTPTDHRALPRSSAQQAAFGPGVALPPDLAALRPGDLVFFDAKDDDGVIDHVGIYLGVDTLGHHRMLNSRNSMHGPTMRDGSGQDGESTARSILDGTGLYARSFVAARRL